MGAETTRNQLIDELDETGRASANGRVVRQAFAPLVDLAKRRNFEAEVLWHGKPIEPAGLRLVAGGPSAADIGEARRLAGILESKLAASGRLSHGHAAILAEIDRLLSGERGAGRFGAAGDWNEGATGPPSPALDRSRPVDVDDFPDIELPGDGPLEPKGGDRG